MGADFRLLCCLLSSEHLLHRAGAQRRVCLRGFICRTAATACAPHRARSALSLPAQPTPAAASAHPTHPLARPPPIHGRAVPATWRACLAASARCWRSCGEKQGGRAGRRRHTGRPPAGAAGAARCGGAAAGLRRPEQRAAPCALLPLGRRCPEREGRGCPGRRGAAACPDERDVPADGERKQQEASVGEDEGEEDAQGREVAHGLARRALVAVALVRVCPAAGVEWGEGLGGWVGEGG